MKNLKYLLFIIFPVCIYPHEPLIKLSSSQSVYLESLIKFFPTTHAQKRIDVARTVYKELKKHSLQEWNGNPLVFQTSTLTIKIKNVFNNHVWIEISRMCSKRRYQIAYDGYISL